MRAATRQQFTIDILDVWLPAANLGLVNLHDGILGIFGYLPLLLLSSPWTLTHVSQCYQFRPCPSNSVACSKCEVIGVTCSVNVDSPCLLLSLWAFYNINQFSRLNTAI